MEMGRTCVECVCVTNRTLGTTVIVTKAPGPSLIKSSSVSSKYPTRRVSVCSKYPTRRVDVSIKYPTSGASVSIKYLTRRVTVFIKNPTRSLRKIKIMYLVSC